MITVLIADDHAAFRRALRTVLELESDFRIVGEAADGDAAFAQALQLFPDVLLADISIPGPGSIELAARLRECLPATCFVVVGDYEPPELLSGALRAGARAYVNKLWVNQGLAQVIRGVIYCREHTRARLDASQRSQLAPLAAPCM